MNTSLASENVVISAPLSFNGSALRIWKMTHSTNIALKYSLLIPLALMLVSFAWMGVAMWYCLMYIVFGIFFIPYRLIRRSGRKQKRDKLRHREMVEAIQAAKN